MRLSVLMSVYNGNRYLPDAIEGILGQTFGDFEFLVVNDGSTDDTAQILALYDDPRITVLENERNMGLAASLNRGLGVARGQYIARQDADDVSHPERLGKQVAFLDAHPKIGVVATTTEWTDHKGNIARVWRQPTHNADIQEALLKYCCVIHGSTMYRQRAIHELSGYDEEMRTAQDYDLWLRLSETWDLACLPQVLYKYRWHRDMASARREREQKRNAEMAVERAIRRRLRYASWILGGRSDDVPERLRRMARRRLAQRYVWWSAGARGHSRNLALWFLIIALLLDPLGPEIWRYIGGIGQRKLGVVE